MDRTVCVKILAKNFKAILSYLPLLLIIIIYRFLSRHWSYLQRQLHDVVTLCAQLTRNLLAMAKFLVFNTITFKSYNVRFHNHENTLKHVQPHKLCLDHKL